MLEKDIQNSILEYLWMAGVYCWRNDSVGFFDPKRKTFLKRKSRFSVNGVSDILGVLSDGRFLAIEVKTPKTKKRVSKDQKSFLEAINRNNGIGVVVWSLDQVVEMNANGWILPTE